MASKPRLVVLAQDPDPGHDPRSAEVREEALRLAFHQGDPDAFAELARPHLDTLYTLCLRMLGDPVLAEDLAQDALARVLQQASRYDPARPFRPWLLKVGLNLCRDRLRAVWWRRVLSLGAIAEGTLTTRGRIPKPYAALQSGIGSSGTRSPRSRRSTGRRSACSTWRK